MIPLISSLCRGPMGVCQLPRFWWKAITRSAGFLDEEYPEFSHGLDKSVVETLELDAESTLRYLREATPPYLDFEAWILQTLGRDPDWRCVNAWNDFNYNRQHYRPRKLVETYGDIGFPVDCVITSAVILNCLQDWQLFFKRDLPGFSSRIGPLISSLDYGPLNLRHLPRMWLTSLLRAKDNLDRDSIIAEDEERDDGLLAAIGTNTELFRCFIADNMPDYLALEDWVANQAGGKINADKASAWNAEIAPPGVGNAILGNKKPPADSPVDRQNLADWDRAYAAVFKRP